MSKKRLPENDNINENQNYTQVPANKIMRTDDETTRANVEELKRALEAQEADLPLINKLMESLNIDFNSPVIKMDEASEISILHYVASKGKASLLKILTRSTKDLEFQETPYRNSGDLAVHFAAGAGNVEVVEYLLSQDISLLNTKNSNGDSPLHVAARHGHMEVARLLISKGAYIKAKANNGFSPLHVAAARGQEEVAKVLLENNADIEAKNSNGASPLHVAAALGHTEMARLLISKGTDIEAKENNGFSPLHVAAARGQEEVAKVLLENNADIEAKNSNGASPLHVAAALGQEEVAKVLLENNADIEAKNSNGASPLHVAAFQGHTEMARLLISKGADIEAKENNGFSPLHVAAARGQEEVAKVLLENNADIEAKDSNGASHLYVAAWQGKEEVVKVLLENGCPLENLSNLGVVQKLCDITKVMRDICQLKSVEASELVKVLQDREFGIRVFEATLVKNSLPYEDYDQFKNKLQKIYVKTMQDDLLKELQDKIESCKQFAQEEIKLIDSMLLSHLHGISPMPYSEDLIKREFSEDEASESAVREHKQYIDFWNDPKNDKYKISGTQLIEYMSCDNQNQFIPLVELLLKSFAAAGSTKTQYTVNPAEDLMTKLFQLDRVVLSKKFKQPLEKIIVQYKKYKDDPIVNTLLEHLNEGEEQKAQIEKLNLTSHLQQQQIEKQENKLNYFSMVIKNLCKAADIDFNPDHPETITGSYSDHNANTQQMDAMGSVSNLEHSGDFTL